MSNKYIIGIDGGGTKTKGVLFDLNGNIIKEITLGPSNMAVDQALALHTIDQVLEILVDDVNKDEVGQIVLGVAGASKILNEDIYLKSLKVKYQTSILLTTDAHIALYAVDALEHEASMLILSGTGSTVMSKDGNQTHMIGGYGHLLGDEGSAYHVVIKAIKMMIKHHEEDIHYSKFEQELIAHLKIKDIQGVKGFVYGQSKTDIADVAKWISSAASKGDLDAIKLLENEGVLLAKQAVNAYKKLHTVKPLVIACKGGFIEKASYVKESFKKEIEKHIKNYRITTEEKDPIYGAFLLAKSQLRGLNQ